MENITTIFNYENTPITFDKGESVMVNATEMAKAFGKRPIDWLQNQSTNDFLDELSKVRKSTLADLVRVTKGGSGSGTWMQEDVALEFARWLSPKFAIWCNDHIKELLKQGSTATFSVPQSFSEALRLAAEQQERIESLQHTNNEQTKQICDLTNTIADMQDKVSYLNIILSSKETMCITQIAQDYGMSAKAFNILLRNFNVQRKVNKQWVLYTKHLANGYVTSETINILRKDGTTLTKLNTVWTQKGRLFLYNLLKQHGYLPLIEK